MSVCEAILELLSSPSTPLDLFSDSHKEFFTRVCATSPLPKIPLNTTTSLTVIAPCDGGFPTTNHVNSENTETYAIWPYQLFAINRSGEKDFPNQVGLDTFDNAMFGHDNTAWRYDAIQSAVLGRGGDAFSFMEDRVLNQGTCENSTFSAYLANDWGDGAPQLESNGIVSLTLQKTVVQTDGRRILLFPAFLNDLYDVEFQLYMPGDLASGAPAGEIRVKTEDGKVSELLVTPPERYADVEIM